MDTSDLKLRAGLRFLHARQITRTSTAHEPVPEECSITRVTRTTVYFRNSTGFLFRIDRDRFPEIVREWLSAPRRPR